MFNKLITRTFFSLALAFGFTSAANATLITQGIFFDSAFTDEVDYQQIGFITIDTRNADVYDLYGDQSVILGDVVEWVEFSFYNFDLYTQAESDVYPYSDPKDLPLFGNFMATFDVNNLSAGIEFLTFDVTAKVPALYAFNGYVDTFGGEAYDLFDANGNFYDYGGLALSKAILTAVPTPATLVLFLTAMVGLTMRRQKS